MIISNLSSHGFFCQDREFSQNFFPPLKYQMEKKPVSWLRHHLKLSPSTMRSFLFLSAGGSHFSDHENVFPSVYWSYFASYDRATLKWWCCFMEDTFYRSLIGRKRSSSPRRSVSRWYFVIIATVIVSFYRSHSYLKIMILTFGFDTECIGYLETILKLSRASLFKTTSGISCTVDLHTEITMSRARYLIS